MNVFLAQEKWLIMCGEMVQSCATRYASVSQAVNLAAPERLRQSGRSVRAGLVAVRRRVPEQADAMLAADNLVALDAPFVGRRDHAAAGDDVVLADVAAGAGREAAIRLRRTAPERAMALAVVEKRLAGI